MPQEPSRANPDSEADIVRCAVRGDAAAFEQLVRRHRAYVEAVAFMRTGNFDDAQDLAQEVFARAWQGIVALGDACRFQGWLKAITLNACHSWHRKSVRWPLLLDDDAVAESLVDAAPQPLESLLAREGERALRQAMARLPEGNRLALLMHVWGGCSYEAIAAALEVPVTTVEGRIFRARARLRLTIGDSLRGNEGEL